MKMTKYLKKSIATLSLLFALTSGSELVCAQQPTGLGESAASILNEYSSDALMEELLNSPFLSDEDRKQLQEMSPEEQQKLFDDVVGIFNDPEFQAILNDPEFAKQMEEVSQMLEAGDFDFDSLEDLDDFEEEEYQPQLPPAPSIPPTIPEVSEIPKKPTVEACNETAEVLRKIHFHLSSLMSKSPYYESIEQYVDVFKTKIEEFQYYIELMKKSENLGLLASDEYTSLNKSLCKLMNILATFEPEILLDETPQNNDLYNPYEILGISRGAREADITRSFERIAQQKSPEYVKERLQTQGLGEKELAKKLKAAELAFEPIQKAYDDLMDKEFRQEIDRILEAEHRREKGLEHLAQQAIWEIIRALDEVFFSPGTVLKETKALLEKYDAQALEMRKKREEEESIATKKIEEYSKKQARLTPLPLPKPEIQYGIPKYDQPKRPQIPTFEKPTPDTQQPSGMSPQGPKKPDAKKPEEKKDEKKDDKKEEKKDDKKDEKKEGKKEEKKPEDDDVTKSIKALDALLNDIEGGKKGKIEAKKRDEFVQRLRDMNTDLRSTVDKNLDKPLEELTEKLRLETLNEHGKKVAEAIKGFEKKKSEQPPMTVSAAYNTQKKAFDSFLKDHKDVLQELELLRTITADQMQDPIKKVRYFPTTRKVLAADSDEEIEQTYPAEAPELFILQKGLNKFFGIFAPLKIEFDPEAKRKIAEEKAQKELDEKRAKMKKKHK